MPVAERAARSVEFRSAGRVDPEPVEIADIPFGLGGDHASVGVGGVAMATVGAGNQRFGWRFQP
ncbi:MAG: hypothetical protein ACMVO3_19100 [Thalassobaculum sp.]